MGAFILYMAKASVCLFFFAILFRLLMMNETFFRFNRILLLAGLVVCSLLPFVNIRTDNALGFQRPIAQLEKIIVSYQYVQVAPPETTDLHVSVNPTDTDDAASVVSERKSFPLFGIVLGVYVLGVLAMLVRLFLSVFRLWQLVHRYRSVKHNGYELVVCRENVAAFSFLDKIVISEADFTANPEEIILHEQMHIKYRHSWDVLFSQLFLIVHWFNPAVWSLCRDLREIHEYEADKAVLKHGIDAQKYQLLLVKKAVGEKQFGEITNRFNHSKIRNRIGMMLRNDSHVWARLKVLLLVPILGAVLLSFSQPVAHQQNELTYDDGEVIRDQEFRDSYALIEKRYTEHSVIVFLNTRNKLLFMTRQPEGAAIRASQLDRTDDAAMELKNIILTDVRRKNSRSIDFILIAPEKAYMQTISRVKGVMVQAYEQALTELAATGVQRAAGGLPLTIKYTMHSYDAGGEVDIAERLMQIVE